MTASQQALLLAKNSLNDLSEICEKIHRRRDRRKNCSVMGASSYGVVISFFCYFISLASATVLFNSSYSFPDLPAKFDVRVSGSGICGALYVADPLDACSFLRNGVESKRNEQEVMIVLISRGECSFETKILNAQIAGYRAAIVYDDREKNDLVYMMGNPEGIRVHAVFVSKESGESLRKFAKGKDGECCIFPPQFGKAWTVLAISFISVGAILCLIVIAYYTSRQWRYWRGRVHNPNSVDIKMVESLPCIKFSSVDSSQCHVGETCSICLEDYKDGENLKLLPCKHAFHPNCVGSWLTKWGTFCPVCKLDMRTKGGFSEAKRGLGP